MSAGKVRRRIRLPFTSFAKVPMARSASRVRINWRPADTRSFVAKAVVGGTITICSSRTRNRVGPPPPRSQNNGRTLSPSGKSGERVGSQLQQTRISLTRIGLTHGHAHLALSHKSGLIIQSPDIALRVLYVGAEQKLIEVAPK